MDQPVQQQEFYNPPAKPGNAVSVVAQTPAQLRLLLLGVIVGEFEADNNATVVGFELDGSNDGKTFIASVHFGSDATPDLTVAVPASQAFVQFEMVDQSDLSLVQAWQKVLADIAALVALAAPGSTAAIYAHKGAISGAGGAVMVGVLWRLIPPIT